MVRHQAVRNHFKPVISGGTQNLRADASCAGRFAECPVAIFGTNCEEIRVNANVVEALKTGRSCATHIRVRATHAPSCLRGPERAALHLVASGDRSLLRPVRGLPAAPQKCGGSEGAALRRSGRGRSATLSAFAEATADPPKPWRRLVRVVIRRRLPGSGPLLTARTRESRSSSTPLPRALRVCARRAAARDVSRRAVSRSF